MKNLKVIIIGNGSIANKYKKILKVKFKNSKFFLIPSRSFLINNNINSSYTGLFQNNFFDLAIVCSPANMHIKHSIILAKKKINLIIEKPLSSIISKEIYNLEKILKKNKIICHVGYMFKFSSAAQELKNNLMKTIGNLRYAEVICHSFLPNWRKKKYTDSVSAKKKLGGGVINELSHEIHLSRWFFGMPKKVISYNFNSKKLDIDCEDNSISILNYSKNFKLFMSLSFSKNNNKKRYIFICGTKGEIKWNLIKNNITVINHNKKKIIKFKKENLYLKQLEYVLKMKKHLVSYQEGVDVLKIILKMKEKK